MPHESPSQCQDWLELGFEILGRHGEKALTIDTLCQRMGRTKGAFYHHFKGRRAFIQALMDHWEHRYTAGVIEAMAPHGDPRRRLLELSALTTEAVDLRLERAIRVWADREPSVRATLERVDGQREGYLFAQFEALTGSARRARLAARCHMAIFVGTQMLYQDLTREALREVNALAETLGMDFGSGQTEPEVSPIDTHSPASDDEETIDGLADGLA
ncbi:MAG: TetR/AcrR family transcriptional regulator [Acidobacteriota bacterium]